MAGAFDHIGGFWTGAAAQLDAIAGDPLPGANRARLQGGEVHAIVADGSGGQFLGGTFLTVGDVPCSSLAHLLADGRLDRRFCHDIWSEVDALAVSGDTLYVGGNFSSRIQGLHRTNAAAFDLATGELMPWNPDPDYAVSTLGLGDGRVYAGGDFTRIGGRPRTRLAALDPRTGDALDWAPDPDNAVFALAVDGGVVYAGGYFDTIGGANRPSLAAIDEATGLATDWNPVVDRMVYSLTVANGTVYIGGDFSSIDGEPRSGAAALDETTGAVTDWAPEPSARVWAFQVTPEAIYLGGEFDQIGGLDQPNVAAVDPATGRLEPWRANGTDGTVFALLADGQAIHVGGQLTSVGAEWRPGLAALDLATGNVLPWAPDLSPPRNPNISWQSSQIYALAQAGDTLYVGGHMYCPQPDLNNCMFAAVDATTGALLPWAPRIDGPYAFPRASALAVADGNIYLAGQFTSVGGRPVSGFAAVDARGNPTANQPTVDGEVWDLATWGRQVVVAGDFTQLNGVDRAGLGALDAATGDTTAWNPAPDGSVDHLIPTASTGEPKEAK